MLLYSYSAGASSWSVGRPASRGDYIPILLLRLLYLVHCRKVESSSETGELALNYPLSKDQFVIHSLWRMAVPLLESNQYNLFRKDLLCNKLFETGLPLQNICLFVFSKPFLSTRYASPYQKYILFGEMFRTFPELSAHVSIYILAQLKSPK